MKILLMEDDLILHEILLEHLIASGHNVTGCEDGQEAETLIFNENFDLLLLDVNVPHIDGFSLVESIRDNGIKTPAVFVTSLNTTKDLKRGYAVGGDEYIKKPFDMDELDVRLLQIQKVFNLNDDLIILPDGRDFDPVSHTIDGKKLRKKESEILHYLLRNVNRAVSAQEFMDNLWAFDDVPSNATLRTYIKNLRQVLGKEMIVTVHGEGFKIETK
ncbi:response regulator transcription factor [Sulfurimonas sp. MAG313]|nr:response regulator transcription factor [Sulfurimonas sp. MAG313]MDF1881336.1 response regulator transcription factor [Sulfurimonas sp. MAG313]